MKKKRIITPTLNEAIEYNSAFSRGVSINLGRYTLIEISGTASVGENGESLHEDDFLLQTDRTFENLSGLLENAGVTWHDVIRTRCYLKHMYHHYDSFNNFRTSFYNGLRLNPYPASLCIEANLCRPELLVEIELTAIKETHMLKHHEDIFP